MDQPSSTSSGPEPSREPPHELHTQPEYHEAEFASNGALPNTSGVSGASERLAGEDSVRGGGNLEDNARDGVNGGSGGGVNGASVGAEKGYPSDYRGDDIPEYDKGVPVGPNGHGSVRSRELKEHPGGYEGGHPEGQGGPGVRLDGTSQHPQGINQNGSNLNNSNGSHNNNSNNNNNNNKNQYQRKPGCNLIINYLPQTLTQSDLGKLFEEFGTILHCKVVRDKHMNQSLGYGFVLFENREEAAAALQAMDGYRIGHKTLKVSVARPPEEHKAPRNLYISGLPPHYQKSNVAELVTKCGADIEDINLLYNRSTRRFRGVAFVRVGTKQQAEDVIQELTGLILKGGNLKVICRFARTQKPRYQGRRVNGQGNVRGGGGGGMNVRPGAYGPLAQRRAPMNMYDPYARPVNKRMYPRNPQPYENYSYPQQGQYYDTRGQFGRDVYLRQYIPPPPPPTQQPLTYPQTRVYHQGVCLFVCHLPLEMDEPALYALFANYGTVLSTKVIKDLRTGRSKGFGFVNMLDERMAENAIHHLNGFQMGNNSLSVSYKK